MLNKDFYSKIKLFAFDLDGTLVDGRDAYISAAQRALAEQGYEYSTQQIERVFGQRVQKAFSDLIPKINSERKAKIKTAHSRFDELCCTEEYLEKIVLLPYAKEVVERMKRENYTLALVTNNDRVVVEAILKRHTLKNYWDYIITGDEGFTRKEDAMLALMKHFNVKPEETCYVADMVKDVRVARKVGCKIISVPSLLTTEKELRKAKPNHLVHNLGELIKDLDQISNKNKRITI